MEHRRLVYGWTLRVPSTECEYKCGEAAGVLTLLETNPPVIQMDRPPKTRGPSDALAPLRDNTS